VSFIVCVVLGAVFRLIVVLFCVMCYLFVVSYCKPLPPGKNPFAVNKYYITYITMGTNVSSSLSDTVHYVVIRELLDSIFNIHPVFLFYW
jgi:hypothetical protein